MWPLQRLFDRIHSGVESVLGRIGSRKPAVVLVFVVMAALVFYFRPWVQWLVYGLYVTPTAWIFATTLLVVTVYFTVGSPPVSAKVIVASLFVVFVVTTGIAGLYASEELSDSTMASTDLVGNLSESDAQNPRILTKNVSENYVANTLNLPQYQALRPDITFINETPHWSYSLSPDGARNHFILKQRGAAYVDMTEQNAQVKSTSDGVEKGIGTAWYNHYNWQSLKKSEYLVSYRDPLLVPHQNETYVAVPYIKPSFHMRWTPVPVPYTTPEWGGVVLVSPNGSVDRLSPAEARSHPVLEGQRLYPFELAERRVRSTRFRNGIVNTLPVVGAHRGEIAVAPTPGSGNDQPYLVPTEDGIEYIVAAEPANNAQGLREIWSLDGRTGEPEMYASSEEARSSLFGPRKAADYVRQAARRTDWNRFTPAEPVPVVSDGRLYWMVRVVPDGGSGIAYVAFVNAESSAVREVDRTPAVESFLAGNASVADTAAPANASDSSSSPSSSSDGGEAAIVVERRSANGTVIERMTVYENESVAIERGVKSNATNSTGE
jgi:hypothetical protein